MSRPFRYTFILALVALATGLAALGGWRYARASAPVSGPVILVSIDSLRADRLPAYGYTGVATPAFDALAADGIVFDRAYAHAPQTLPAHAALLTGQLPFENGVRDDTGFVLADRERSVAEMLRDRGYMTGAVVSSYLLRRETGLAQGFAFFDDELRTATGETGEPGTGLWRPGADATAVAEEWLAGAGSSRVFLLLHLVEPQLARLPSTDRTADATYDVQITRVDEAVGRLIRYLKSHQLYDASTIILVADHGEGLGDHGEQGHGLLVYEEALHVPLIIKRAAGEGAGRRVQQPVQHIDIVPTLLDLAKAPGADNLRGRSLIPLLDGRRQTERRLIYAESLYGHYQFGWNPIVTLTDGAFRYIRSAREELYELAADRAGRVNLADDSGRDLEAWRQALARLDRTTPTAASATPVDVRSRLEAVGYLMGHGVASQVVPDASAAELLRTLETRRTAAAFATLRDWPRALDALQAGLGREPASLDLWLQLASTNFRFGRDDQALAAYRRVLALDPADETAQLTASSLLLRLRKLDEARQAATAVATGSEDPTMQAAGHSLLAEIAIARGDARRAREEAALAAAADPSWTLKDYVEARVLAAAAEHEAALPHFQAAVAATAEAGRGPFRDLQYHFAGSLRAAKRLDDAERAYLEELDAFPGHMRARIELALLYHELGRAEAAADTVAALTALTPTAEASRQATMIWEEIGDSRRAAEARAEARRLDQKAIPLHQTTRR